MHYINPYGNKYTVVPYDAVVMKHGVKSNIALMRSADVDEVPAIQHMQVARRACVQMQINGCALWIGDAAICVDGRKEYLTLPDKDLTLVPGPHANTYFIQGNTSGKWLGIDNIMSPVAILPVERDNAVFFLFDSP